jgi:CheY-like chemotaxis protein
MDCKLPIFDGFDVTQQIRQFELANNLPITPIIAVTARVFDDERQACFDAGMSGYIAKPVTLNALLEQIDKCCVTPKGKIAPAINSNGLGRML